jgi:hypothetical protein
LAHSSKFKIESEEEAEKEQGKTPECRTSSLGRLKDKKIDMKETSP